MSKLPNVNIGYVCQILEYLFIIQKNQKILTLIGIKDYFEKSEKYTKESVFFLEYFEIIIPNNDTGEITINKDSIKLFDGTHDNAVLLIKSKITRFKPYIEYYYFQSIGKTANESTKLIKQIYFLDQSDKLVSDIFEYWSKSLKINNEIKYSDQLTTTIKDGSYLDDELSIQKFIKEQLGDNFKFIDEAIISDIFESLKDYKNDPSKAVNDAGRGLEDFLRFNIGDKVDLSKCSGIVQISNELVSKSIITSKHQAILNSLGNIRSMGDAHGADKRTKERWVVSTSGVLIYILQILLTINSLCTYKYFSLFVY